MYDVHVCMYVCTCMHMSCMINRIIVMYSVFLGFILYYYLYMYKKVCIHDM